MGMPCIVIVVCRLSQSCMSFLFPVCLNLMLLYLHVALWWLFILCWNVEDWLISENIALASVYFELTSFLCSVLGSGAPESGQSREVQVVSAGVLPSDSTQLLINTSFNATIRRCTSISSECEALAGVAFDPLSVATRQDDHIVSLSFEMCALGS